MCEEKLEGLGSVKLFGRRNEDLEADSIDVDSKMFDEMATACNLGGDQQTVAIRSEVDGLERSKESGAQQIQVRKVGCHMRRRERCS